MALLRCESSCESRRRYGGAIQHADTLAFALVGNPGVAGAHSSSLWQCINGPVLCMCSPRAHVMIGQAR